MQLPDDFSLQVVRKSIESPPAAPTDSHRVCDSTIEEIEDENSAGVHGSELEIGGNRIYFHFPTSLTEDISSG
jgi:hypothetical protein